MSLNRTAKGIVLVDDIDESLRISARLSELDQEHQISAKFRAAADTGKAKLTSFDEEHKITETISAKAAAIDEQYQLSAKAADAKAAVMANATVQSAAALFGSWGGSLSKAVSDLKADTLAKASQLKSSGAATPQPGAQ